MRVAPILFCLSLAACATAPAGGVNDPYEPMNRRVHAFNKGLDATLLRPVARAARGGDDAAPQGPGAMTLVGNFGSNLALPGKVVNSVLQGRPEPAVRNTFRFFVNSTLGLGGLLDPATADFALPEIDTDFGETLHVWGVPEGAYLELPVLGPSTERDLAGKVVDLFIDPLDSVLTDEQKIAGTAARIVSKAGDRARFGSTVDSVLHESADSYAQTRLLYLQHRRFELKQEQDVIDPYAD
ncbi:MAG TPA: VacJ family lipoprotein [Paracoccus sp. (in: a-proteobacteria)]|nr:VacJ family lipoprotein [Paracoccus sp. (in: a-proteobacteria)]